MYIEFVLDLEQYCGQTMEDKWLPSPHLDQELPFEAKTLADIPAKYQEGTD
jgi:hypothetical protein